MMKDTTEIPGFTSRVVEGERGAIFLYEGGDGFPVLLLHGFPETNLMWREIAPLLAGEYKVIAADLPGYGRSNCPDERLRDAMSKREIATTLVEAMRSAGHDRFAIVGHDRGGRVAYRAALDHPACVSHVAVLDVVPTFDVWDRADARLALAFWPFSLLAQPSPLPERLIFSAPDAVVDNALGEWGTPRDVFPDWVRETYIAALSDPGHIHAICEEYRAASSIDRENDAADLGAGRRINCPLLALWSESGALASWYDDAGGPLALWRRWAIDVQGRPMTGGHFFPEEHPAITAGVITDFLKSRMS
ncbi:alpha/beta hydrolase [Mesorhizobium abyssinicae]|uniref:alpha/beta fold hydrolase n=2 Tax=Mesorhizobium TaxID=68287 RepID=UPI002A247E2E|nr:alpha/beta hydrolase [Mesorhizobium abyssinicae]MDX8435591.1 alpha/beta hydrolase [Mesorhizobium abyssinicae]